MQVTKSERLHIAFFGCTNGGKSSLVNALTNQQLSVVSDIKGTTTDPVQKAMELLPIGPVVIIDTAGLDDGSDLGKLRIEKTLQVLGKTDIAVLVIDAAVGVQEADKKLIKEFKERKLKHVVVYNKCDLVNFSIYQKIEEKYLPISAKTGEGVNELKEILGKLANENVSNRYILRDLIKQGDVIILVTPIDESAPKGRLILPQQNVLREILDSHSTAVCCQVEELENTLKKVHPDLVITDSQVFDKVKSIVSIDIPLTSFSVLMARYRGKLDSLIKGVSKISELKDGSNILISEGCTHHRQCNDIGTVKFPKWLSEYTGKKLNFEFTQGGEFPKKLYRFDIIIHCGGCMLNEAEMNTRIKMAEDAGVPIVNYGMAIAYMNGILERSLEIFKKSD